MTRTKTCQHCGASKWETHGPDCPLAKLAYDGRPDEHLMETFGPIESDPHGKAAHEPGAKLDAGKQRPGLVLTAFAHALDHVVRVGTFGAAKYSDDGWLSVPQGHSRYTDAMYRHLLAEAKGEDFDEDSHLLHAAHAAWNALARLELMLRERAG